MDICLSPARAAASRRNGAKSRGPNTPGGKTRSAQNGLKHGLRAQKHVVLPGEDTAGFQALETALIEDLAPVGALQSLLAARIARAAWRLERAERIEAELFAREMHGPSGDGDLGLALIRDGNGARAFATLLRYRGTALAELWRALRLFKALQAEAVARPQASAPATPVEPEARGNAGEIASIPPDGKRVATVVALALPEKPPLRCEQPIEPEALGNPGEIASAPAADGGGGRAREKAGAHPATQKCVTMRRSCAAHAPPPASRA